jgi:excisionase family DNA binding protein
MYFSIAKHGMLAPADPTPGSSPTSTRSEPSSISRSRAGSPPSAASSSPCCASASRCAPRPQRPALQPSSLPGDLDRLRRAGAPQRCPGDRPESLGDMPRERFEAFWVEARLFLLRRPSAPARPGRRRRRIRAEIEAPQEGDEKTPKEAPMADIVPNMLQTLPPRLNAVFDEKDLIPIDELARLLGISRKRVQILMDSGRLTFHDFGTGTRCRAMFSRADVEDYWQRSASPAREPLPSHRKPRALRSAALSGLLPPRPMGTRPCWTGPISSRAMIA